MQKKERKLAAVMFTDIVGYSAMMQKDETVTSRLRNRHREVFKKLTKRYEGQVIQYFGDGTLSIYSSASAAVECAVNLQKELKGNPPVPLRIGIHTGEITYGDEDVHGDGVNVAARIESLCVPGGVFISGKVYDDIKNHSWLKAKSLGLFQLKNIRDKKEIYVITNEGVTVPDDGPIIKATTKPPNLSKKERKKNKEEEEMALAGTKNKFIAGGLGIGLGMFGIHRFYLGQKGLGIAFLVNTLLALFIVPAMAKFIPVLAILGFVDGMVLMLMPKDGFNAKYNAHLQKKTASNENQVSTAESFTDRQFDQYWEKGVEEYKEYDYAEAVKYLSKATTIKYDEPEAHFLLACCYSMLENAEKAFFHLDVAVGFRLENEARIKTNDDLSFLRFQPGFDEFVENNYRIKDTPQHIEPSNQPDLLEQLNNLQKLRNDGVLTEEEFLKEQARIKLDRS